MSRTLNNLNPAEARAKPPGKYGDGGGLWLYKRQDGGAQWVLRYTLHGRRHEMGLGRYPDVSLKEAREAANGWRAVVRQGVDPIKQREKEAREAKRNMHVLADIAKDAFESRKAELKGEGKAGRWFTPLELHILPKLGKMPVSEIDQRDIRDTLAPIWHTKAVTAYKALIAQARPLRRPNPQGCPLQGPVRTRTAALQVSWRQEHRPAHGGRPREGGRGTAQAVGGVADQSCGERQAVKASGCRAPRTSLCKLH